MVAFGCVKTINSLLSNGQVGELNARIVGGSAFSNAIIEEKAELFDFLLKQKCLQFDGWNAVSDLFKYKRADFLERAVRAEKINPAIWRGSVDGTEFLPKWVLCKKIFGNTLLHVAMIHWDDEDDHSMFNLVASYVRRYGLNPNATNNFGYTALLFGVLRGLAAVKKLVDDVKVDIGETALAFACKNRDTAGKRSKKWKHFDAVAEFLEAKTREGRSQQLSNSDNEQLSGVQTDTINK